MKQITKKENCTGCQACRLLCPKQCISIIDDNEGFPIPHVDDSICVDCGLCALKCPENTRSSYTQNTPVRVIGAKYKNDTLLSKSASGGVFVGIAHKILSVTGNAVFGCALDENMTAHHFCVTDFNNIGALQSSKYVQSNVGDTYKQAQQLLKEGKTVFYTGLPCQIAGLYAFLGEQHDNLITADLICHGVPSPLLFKKYIEWISKKFRGKIIQYNFRYKGSNENGYTIEVKIKTKTKTKTKVIPAILDPYFSSFLELKTHRESCYTCKYANANRTADVTLGDFWGIESAHPDFSDRRGVSVVLMNTSKGVQMLSDILEDFDTVESTFEIASLANTNLRYLQNRPEQRNTVYKDINNDKVNIFVQSYLKINVKLYAKVKIKSFIKRLLPQKALGVIRHIRR